MRGKESPTFYPVKTEKIRLLRYGFLKCRESYTPLRGYKPKKERRKKRNRPKPEKRNRRGTLPEQKEVAPVAEKKQTGGTGKRAKSEKPAVLSGTVPEWSSTTAISQLLGKTVRRVQQLTQEGVLETEIPPGGGARKYRTCATVQRYVAYVEAKAQETGENSRAAELTLKKLEAEVELKESQGQLHRLKTAIAEGRYLAADHATEELTEFMASFKKFAMNIPPRMAGTMSGYADAVAIRAMEKAMRKELESLLAAFSDGAIMEEREDAAP